MTTPQALHHSLLRPCVLQILRAAGYHSTRSSVLDTLTDLAARYLLLLASTTVENALVNHDEVEISLVDVRMALEQCGALVPQIMFEDEAFSSDEDLSGVQGFIEWAQGPVNKEIKRIATDGDAGADDYLTALKKKAGKGDEEAKFNGTLLGKSSAPREVKVEGASVTTMKEWAAKVVQDRKAVSRASSRQSSILSSLGDEEMEGLEFD